MYVFSLTPRDGHLSPRGKNRILLATIRSVRSRRPPARALWSAFDVLPTAYPKAHMAEPPLKKGPSEKHCYWGPSPIDIPTVHMRAACVCVVSGCACTCVVYFSPLPAPQAHERQQDLGHALMLQSLGATRARWHPYFSALCACLCLRACRCPPRR